jgi:hypothetical protein
MRSADFIEQCLSLEAKRKTSTRTEYFAFCALARLGPRTPGNVRFRGAVKGIADTHALIRLAEFRKEQLFGGLLWFDAKWRSGTFLDIFFWSEAVKDNRLEDASFFRFVICALLLVQCNQSSAVARAGGFFTRRTMEQRADQFTSAKNLRQG